MQKASNSALVIAIIALAFGGLNTAAHAGKTKEEKQIAKAERLLEKAERLEEKAEEKRVKAEAEIVQLEAANGLNGQSGTGGTRVIDSEHCGGPGQPLC